MIIYEEDVDEFLEHYGVKGQRWGVRRAQKHRAGPLEKAAYKTRKKVVEPALDRREARKRNRELNKASRAKDRAIRDREITRARQRINLDKTDAKYREAKSQHAANKVNLGKREARKLLRQAKARRYSDYEMANQAKSGKETTQAILAAAGIGLLTYGALRLADTAGRR